MNAEQWDEWAALDALGALEPDEQALFDARVEVDAQLAARRDELRHAVAQLDQLRVMPPPPSTRGALLAAARRMPSTVEAAEVGELFARQVDALAELLVTLAGADWNAPAAPYPWTVHGLVAHLLVIEDYTACQLGLAAGGPQEAAHLAMGAARIDAALTQPPQKTAAAWTARARATAAARRERAADLPASLTLHGWPFELDGALIARAFEVWTHADDIRRATGRPPATPEPADLRTMSTFSLATLPFTVPLVRSELDAWEARVVLTGAGGGSVDLSVGAEGPRTVLILDVVDYCRLVARRLEPDQLDHRIEGDVDLARALLAGASVFAV